MKYPTAALLLSAAAAVAGATPPHARPAQDLRATLQQYTGQQPAPHPGAVSPESAPAPVPAPRQLTPGELAELRRQLSEYGPPTRRR
jgi:hypothetical protein